MRLLNFAHQTPNHFIATDHMAIAGLLPDAGDDGGSAVPGVFVNWAEPEIILDRSQNAVMVVSRRDLLWLHHGPQKHRVDSFWFVIPFRLVKRDDHERALHLFVFRNPSPIVEMEPGGEKHA